MVFLGKRRVQKKMKNEVQFSSLGGQGGSIGVIYHFLIFSMLQIVKWDSKWKKKSSNSDDKQAATTFGLAEAAVDMLKAHRGRQEPIGRGCQEPVGGRGGKSP